MANFTVSGLIEQLEDYISQLKVVEYNIHRLDTSAKDFEDFVDYYIKVMDDVQFSVDNISLKLKKISIDENWHCPSFKKNIVASILSDVAYQITDSPIYDLIENVKYDAVDISKFTTKEMVVNLLEAKDILSSMTDVELQREIQQELLLKKQHEEEEKRKQEEQFQGIIVQEEIKKENGSCTPICSNASSPKKQFTSGNGNEYTTSPYKPVVTDVSHLSYFEQEIYNIIVNRRGIKAAVIAELLRVRKKEINHYLYGSLKKYVRQDDEYKWYPAGQGT